MIKRIALASLACLALATPSWPSSVPITVGSGFTFGLTTDGTNNIGYMSLCGAPTTVAMESASGCTNAALVTSGALQVLPSPYVSSATYTSGGGAGGAFLVNTGSTRIALPGSGFTTVSIYNVGSNSAGVALGNASVTAVVANDVVQPGSSICLGANGAVDLAAITSVSTTTLNVTTGSGQCSNSAAGNGSGLVNQGAAGSLGAAWPVQTVGNDTYPTTQTLTTNDAGSGSTTWANSQAIVNGTPTSTGVATFAINGVQSVNVQVSGSATGQVQVELSKDGTNYIRTSVKQTGVALYQSTFGGTGVTPNLNGTVNTAGFVYVRVRAVGATWSGTANVNVTETYITNQMIAVDGSGVTQPVNVTSEVGVGSTGSAVPSTAQYSSMNVAGNLTGMTGTANGLKVDGSAVIQPVVFPSADPCMANAHAYTPISITSATTTQIVTNAGSKKIYVCFLHMIAGTANNVAIVEGTGTTCGTGTTGMVGGATAANGDNFAANGGANLGSGEMAVAATVTTGDNLCLITSSAGPLSGVLVTAQQ